MDSKADDPAAPVATTNGEEKESVAAPPEATVTVSTTTTATTTTTTPATISDTNTSINTNNTTTTVDSVAPVVPVTQVASIGSVAPAAAVAAPAAVPSPAATVAPVSPKFIVESVQTSEDRFIVTSKRGPQQFRVSRTAHDFQFLEQQLFHSGQCLDGYIIPPFPEDLGSQTLDSNVLPGYGRFVSADYQLFCWLKHVLEHPIFGKSGLLEPFLTEDNLPPPGKISRPMGLIKSIQDSIDSRKYAHKDCDPFFQKERDWCSKVYELIQQSTEAFKSIVDAGHSLSQVLAHLSAALSLPVGDNTGPNRVALQTNIAFSKAIDRYKDYVEADTINRANTLGATLLLWTSFVGSEREMLKQRTCLLVDYETANRNYDRARYQRRPEIEEAKAQAERAFEKCSDTAHGEIKRFQAMRVKDMARSLRDYKDSQLALAKEHYEKMSEIYEEVAEDFRLIQIPAAT